MNHVKIVRLGCEMVCESTRLIQKEGLHFKLTK